MSGKPVTLSAFLARLIWLCMAPLLALAVWFAIDSVRVTEAEHAHTGANLARNYATAVDQFLMARINALNMLAISPLADDTRRWAELYAEAQGFRASFDTHVIFADTARQMRFNTRVPFGTALPALPLSKGRSAAPLALETGRPQVGDIVMGPVANVPLVAIVVPGLRDGKVANLMLTTLETTRLQQRLDSVALPAGWSLALQDGTGADIARHSPPGFDAVRDVDDDHRFVVRTELSPWSVVLEIPRGVHRATLFKSGALLAAAILLATLLGAAAGMFASRRLGRQVAALAAPQESAAPPPDIAEVAAVRRLINQSQRELLESEDRFHRLFDQAPLPLGFVGTDGHVLTLNERFEQVFGYRAADLPRIDDWWRLAYPDPAYRAEVQERWGAAVARATAGGTDVTADEYRITCKDGGQRIMLVSGIVLHDGLLATFFDITGRKRAEEAQAAALGEQRQTRLAALNQMEDANAARREAEAATAEIRRLNADLERRVVERTAELAAANHELESFAYAVSHDLRAPLRAMSGFSQALTEDFGNRLEADAKMYLDQIGIASRKMSDLIDGLLALSRSTRGELRRDDIDLSAVAERRLDELARAEPGRQVKRAVEPGLTARGDARMIDALMDNLLANAWKYTARTPAPEIRVYSELRDGERRICVADNGAGFDMTHAERLFKPFQRLHRQEEFPGLGIGLATVQRIVHRHGGRIEAHGEPGKSATFCFTLPDRAEGSS